MNRKAQSGQTVLIILLIMVVLLTVGLAVVSRSITDIRISKETEESARAFSAAEAGIEEALKHDLMTLTWTDKPISVGDLEANVTVVKTNTFETKIGRNEVAEVNLNGFTGNGINVEWSDSGLELSLIYNSNGYKVARWALWNGSSCGENFTEVSAMPFLIDFSSYPNPKALRIRPICASASVSVTGVGSSILPEQSYSIRSSATIPESNQTRVVEVIKSLPILPAVFDYALFSGSDLVK